MPDKFSEPWFGSLMDHVDMRLGDQTDVLQKCILFLPSVFYPNAEMRSCAFTVPSGVNESPSKIHVGCVRAPATSSEALPFCRCFTASTLT